MDYVSLQASDLCITVKINKYHLVKIIRFRFQHADSFLGKPHLLFTVILKLCRFHWLSLALAMSCYDLRDKMLLSKILN